MDLHQVVLSKYLPSGGLTRDVGMDLHQVVLSKYCTIWWTNQGCVYGLTPSCV